jgi:hypothetical protein
MWALITISLSLLFFSFTALDKNAVVFLFACLLSSRCASRGYYLDSTGWHFHSLGFQFAGTPCAIVKQNGDVNVFYRDSGDGLLHMSYMPAGGNWNDAPFYPMAP